MAQKSPFGIKSIAETQSVVNSLNTLLHYGNEFDKFSPDILEMIRTNCKKTNGSLMHTGLSYGGFVKFKLKNHIKAGLRLAAIFVLLPNLVQQFRKLLKESEARKRLLIRYMRCTLYYALYGALPNPLFCALIPFMGCSKVTAVLSYTIAGIIGFLFETPSRHTVLLGLMLPKAFEALMNILQSRGIYKHRGWHSLLLGFFVWAVIACASILEAKKQAQEKDIDTNPEG